MLPTFESGERALFLPVSNANGSLLGKVVLVARENSFGARDFYQVKRVTDYKDGEFFITGDNPDFSTDSREFGWVRRDEVIAKLLFKLPKFI